MKEKNLHFCAYQIRDILPEHTIYTKWGGLHQWT